MSNVSTQVGFETERSVTGAFTGAFQALGGPLTYNPTIMVFDNQSTVSVQLSADGVNVWKTFSSGEALVLDLRANIGLAANYTVKIGVQFYVKGTAGTGSFLLSILDAR